MSKDDLRLKAVNSLSSFFRKAATALDSLTSVHAEWEGIFPHPTQFEEYTESGHTELRYRLGEKLAVEELSLKHDANRVFLSVNPNCHEYLIPNFDDIRYRAAKGLSDETLERYAELRWDNVSSAEVRSLFLEVFCPNATEDFWAGRAAMLLSLMFSIDKEMAVLEKRSVSAETLRRLMPLDQLIQNDQGTRWLSPEVAADLRSYLTNLPGYHEDDALVGTLPPKVYEQHGYLSMQIMHLLSHVPEKALRRDYRLRSTEIEYQADSPISSVSAKVEDGVLIVSVKYVDTKPKMVEIAA